MSKTVDQNRRSAERKAVILPIEFVVEDDLIKATSVDISETGIRIDTEEPMCLYLRFKLDGEVKNFRARFAWARKTEEDNMTYGLEFLETPDNWDEED